MQPSVQQKQGLSHNKRGTYGVWKILSLECGSIRMLGMPTFVRISGSSIHLHTCVHEAGLSLLPMVQLNFLLWHIMNYLVLIPHEVFLTTARLRKSTRTRPPQFSGSRPTSTLTHGLHAMWRAWLRLWRRQQPHSSSASQRGATQRWRHVKRCGEA